MRRRVVTGLDAEGRSVVIRDGRPPGRIDGSGWEELWAFDGVPASLADPTDPADVETFRLTPAPGRVAVRTFTVYPAGSAAQNTEEWNRRVDHAETEELPSPNSPWMHRTPTVDVIVVVSGEMELVLDGGEAVPLRPGDSVVQRGTMHAWRNTGTEPCVAVAFMVRAD